MHTIKMLAVLPGGNKEEIEVTMPAARCGKCKNCQCVAATQRLVLADSAPAGPGLTTRHVEMWNQVLRANLCQNPELPYTTWVTMVETMLKKRTMCSWADLSGDKEIMQDAYYQGDSPKEFCDWFIAKYELTEL